MPSNEITPGSRLEVWKKLWATPRVLTEAETDAAFEEFEEAFIPSHMRSRFLKQFGIPKAAFGNRYFQEGAVFHALDMPIYGLGPDKEGHVEATVIYASPDRLEAHAMRGQSRRKLRDVFIDDWIAACAIIRSDRGAFYAFIEPKMKGCVVLATA